MDGWWIVVFWVLLVPFLIISGITYGTTKKLYRLMQLLSLFTYIILVIYLIDSFDLGRDWILGILFVSTLLIIGAGYYVSKRKQVAAQ